MSKLANLIEARQTGKIKVIPAKFSPITNVVEETVHVDFGCKMGYRLGVVFEVKGFANIDDGAEIQQMKDMCKRQILHEVFSEFQPMLRRIERALYELDFDEAKSALAELDNEMRW